MRAGDLCMRSAALLTQVCLMLNLGQVQPVPRPRPLPAEPLSPPASSDSRSQIHSQHGHEDLRLLGRALRVCSGHCTMSLVSQRDEDLVGVQ